MEEGERKDGQGSMAEKGLRDNTDILLELINHKLSI